MNLVTYSKSVEKVIDSTFFLKMLSKGIYFNSKVCWNYFPKCGKEFGIYSNLDEPVQCVLLDLCLFHFWVL